MLRKDLQKKTEDSSKPAGKKETRAVEAGPAAEPPPERRRKRLKQAHESTPTPPCDDTPQKDEEATDVNQSPASTKSEKKRKKKRSQASPQTAATGESPAKKKALQTIPAEDTPPQPKKRREEPRPETAVVKAKPTQTNAHQEECEYPDNARERRELKSQAAEANQDGGCIHKKERGQQTRLEDLKHVIRTPRELPHQSVSRHMPEQKQSLIGDYCCAQEGKAKGK